MTVKKDKYCLCKCWNIYVCEYNIYTQMHNCMDNCNLKVDVTSLKFEIRLHAHPGWHEHTI